MLAHDALCLLVVFDWSAVVVALITLVGVLAAIASNLYVVMQLRTPSGKSIGKQVEDTRHDGLATHYRVLALSEALGHGGDPDHPDARKREE